MALGSEDRQVASSPNERRELLVRQLSRVVLDLDSIQRYAQENLRHPDLVEQHPSPRLYWSHVVERAWVERRLSDLVQSVASDHPGARELQLELAAWRGIEADGASTAPSMAEPRHPHTRSRRDWRVYAAAFALLGVAGWWLVNEMPGPMDPSKLAAEPTPRVPSASESGSAVHTAPAATQLPGPGSGTVPAGMVLVPGGTFRRGSADLEPLVRECVRIDGDEQGCRRWLARETPSVQTQVAAFYLDRAEVTNEALALWLEELLEDGSATQRDGTVSDQHHPLWVTPRGHVALRLPQGKGRRVALSASDAQLPVVGVTWYGAERYCAATGRRLPSAAEFEYAARGADAAPYVWARPPSCAEVAFGRVASGNPGHAACAGMPARPNSVGANGLDSSWSGVMDLGSNVSEWVSDPFEDPAPASGETRTACAASSDGSDACRVIKGGSFADPLFMARPAAVTRAPARQGLPHVGFRCAKTAEAP